MLEGAVKSLEGQSGTKEQIISTMKELYPGLERQTLNASFLRRSLDQAFSKHL